MCICLTPDAHLSSDRTDPWLSTANPLTNRTKDMLDRVVELHPQVLFIIRFYAQQTDTTGTADTVVMLNLTDGNATVLGNSTTNTLKQDMNSLTESWEASASAKLATMLTYLDSMYPARIGGAFPYFLHTSEWFMPGPGDVGFGMDAKLSDYSEATWHGSAAAISAISANLGISANLANMATTTGTVAAQTAPCHAPRSASGHSLGRRCSPTCPPRS